MAEGTRTVQWHLVSLSVPELSWHFGNDAPSNLRVLTETNITNSNNTENDITTIFKVAVRIEHSENNEEFGNFNCSIVISSNVQGATSIEVSQNEEIKKEFFKYLIRIGFGHARALMLRAGQEAGISASLLLPYFDKAVLENHVSEAAVSESSE